MPHDEVERIIDEELPEGDYETLAGLVIEQHGRLPEVGQEVRLLLEGDPADFAISDEITGDVLSLEVIALERHVPSLVRVRVIPIERAGDDLPTPDADPAEALDGAVIPQDEDDQ